MLLDIQNKHKINDLIAIFERCLGQDYHTRLVGGADEPFYEPGTRDGYARIYFRDDYFSSALHEIAHWCIAGAERRTKPDYGYWYNADGRSPEEQLAFYRVEVKPQALEWAFTTACNLPFKVSADNLNATAGSGQAWQYWETVNEMQDGFTKQCRTQLLHWLEHGFPVRAEIFIKALVGFYREGKHLGANEFRSNE